MCARLANFNVLTYLPRTTKTRLKRAVDLLYTLTKVILLYFPIICNATNVRKVGDFLQFANPIAAYVVGSYADRDVAFVMAFTASMGAIGVSKWIGMQYPYALAKRPNSGRYNGMPSGHTASSWIAASFVRHIDWRINIPLYVGAIITAYSRVECGAHTMPQVLASIVLAELAGGFMGSFDGTVTLLGLDIERDKVGIKVTYNF